MKVLAGTFSKMPCNYSALAPVVGYPTRGEWQCVPEATHKMAAIWDYMAKNQILVCTYYYFQEELI